MSRIIAWGSSVDQAFRDRVDQGIADMGWAASDGLMASKVNACMAFETGATFDPSIRNRSGSSGTGLIQFMASTAEELGTTTDALAAMSAVKQLDYVFRYFKMFRKLSVESPLLSDLYMSILMPKYIGEPDESIIISGGLQYTQNRGLDTDHDGSITKQEVAARVQGMLTIGYQTPHVWTDAG